jgi:peptidoglycan-N-acetylglucosamine deacetylase
MIRFVRQPLPAKLLYPEALYKIPGPGKRLGLTFDDGPDPSSTPLILDILAKNSIKATFFCTGENVTNNPGLFARIATEGHVVGNHGYYHQDGRLTPVRKYCANAFRGRDITCSNLFRPPYGRLRLRQFKIIERKAKIVFWDMMPYDFDLKLSPEKILSIMKRNLRPGSIIVLHDNSVSKAPLVLQKFIDFARLLGYEFVTLSDNLAH